MCGWPTVMGLHRLHGLNTFHWANEVVERTVSRLFLPFLLFAHSDVKSHRKCVHLFPGHCVISSGLQPRRQGQTRQWERDDRTHPDKQDQVGETSLPPADIFFLPSHLAMSLRQATVSSSADARGGGGGT